MNKAAIVSALKQELKELNKNKATVEAMIAKLSDDGPAKTGKKVKRQYRTKKVLGAGLGTVVGVTTGSDTDLKADASADQTYVDTTEADAKAAKKAALLAKMRAGSNGKAKGPLARKARRPPEAAS